MNNYLKYIFISAVIFLTANVTAQTNKVVEISKPGDKNPVEVSVAVNPQNPDNIVAVFINYTGKGSGVSNFSYVSEDGGNTWAKIKTPNPEKRIQGDDAVAFGLKGNVYHSYLSFTGLEDPADTVMNTSGIYVSSSDNGGKSWYRRAVVVDHLNTNAPMEDKPYIVSDNSPESPYKNNVYLAWTHFDKYGSTRPQDSSQIYFSRSTNLGKSFSSPIRISETGGDCKDSSNTVEGAVTAVAPDGTIYVVWAGPKGLIFTESKDGGKTFGPNKTIGFIYHGWDFKVPGINRANGMPVTKVDLSGGKYKGTIYVNWVDDRFGDPDVFLKYSRNGGRSWSQPVRVNDDQINNGKFQFFSWMAVDPVDGSVNIVYYDRKDYDSTETGLTLARSVDGGKSFKNFKIDQKPFYPNPAVFFGDYTGIDAYDGKVIAAYMYFKSFIQTGINAAIFHFKPGTETIKE